MPISVHSLPGGRVRRFVVLAAIVALLTALSTLASGAGASALAATGTVRGAILGKHGVPKVTIRYFTASWVYIGAVRASGGGYSLSLAPGTYHLQLVDRAPAYEVDKYAPTDVTVSVSAATTTVRNVRMRAGGAVGGKVRAHGKPAKGARVVAANTLEQSFETTTDASGSFALGGLPPGKYSLFTYDREKKWVHRSTFLGEVRKDTFHPVDIGLDKRAGSLLVDLYAGTESVVGSPYVTAVSLASGQFWTSRAQHGSVSFRGLYPGRYRLVAPGYGNYLPQTAAVAQGKVKAGRVAFGSFHWTMPGASITGRVVDSGDGSTALDIVQVLLFDAAGTELARTTSGSDGRFALTGQIATQAGLTVVVQPGATAPYLGQGEHYCKYAAASVGALAVTAGAATDLGVVALPRLPDEQQDRVQCRG